MDFEKKNEGDKFDSRRADGGGYANEEDYASAGDWDESGLVNSFKIKGMDKFSASQELITNSCDAEAKNVTFDIGENNIYVSDDGYGMSKKELIHSFKCYAENNASRKTKGKCGIGATLALSYLSNHSQISTTLSKKKKRRYCSS